MIGKDPGGIVPTSKPTPDARWQQFHGECQTYGVAYADPRSREEDRVKVFGPPDTPENRTEVAFFDYIADVHKKVAPCLEAVQRDLLDQGTTYKVRQLGSYREERADRLYWFHQYGGAIDINPVQNPQCLESGEGLDVAGLCGNEKPYDMPEEWVETFERYGFYWGGNYRRTKDYMHFEWHGEAP